MENLEFLCAKYGMEIGDNGRGGNKADAGIVINKVLGTLAENGVYAMTLLLTSQSKPNQKAIANRMLCSIVNALCEVKLTDRRLNDKDNDENKKNEALKIMRDLTRNFHNLLMAKRLIEQILTFARYHVKSIGEK